MRNTERRRARIEDLTEELAIGAAQRLGCASDDIHSVVSAVVSYLVEEYPAQDLYIPGGATQEQQYPIKELRAAVAAGESIRSVCKRYRLGRRTLYRLLDDAAANDIDECG